MIFKAVILLSVLCFREVFLFDLVAKTSDTYGPFVLGSSRFERCKGPKSRNLTDFDMKVGVVGGAQIGLCNVTFREQVLIDELKISVFTIAKENRKSLLYSYKFKNPCEHFAVGAIIYESFKTDGKCIVKKGNYNFRLNFSEAISQFLGSSFFYGNYETKNSMTSTKGNIMCVVSYLTFMKKTNDKA